jgi:hypothetical protein
MGDFDASHALRDVHERREQIASGEKLVPVLAAVVAVLAAVATLFAHHSSTTALAQKNEAILYQAKATDQYNYFESKRIKVQVDQALIDSGIVPSGSAGRRSMEDRMKKENAQANAILAKAKALEAESNGDTADSERFLRSYESFEVAAVLFQVSIVLVSITALMSTRVLLFVAGGATLVGLGFFAAGVLH